MLLLNLCWIVWGLGAVAFLVAIVGRSLARAKHQLQVESAPAEQLTASDLRVLLMGDDRDPLERHADAMTALWRVVSIAVAGIVLGFITFAA